MRARRPAPPWQLQFAVLTFVWGASFLFIKVAVDDLAPVDVAFVRVALGAVALGAALALGGRGLPRGRVVWGHLAIVALIGNCLPFALIAYSETHISSVLAGIWNATTPLLTMMVATVALPDERPTPRRVAGLLAGFVGVVVVLGPWREIGGGPLAGQLMSLAAAACYGVTFCYMRRFLAERQESGTALSAGQLLCATAQLAIVTIFVGGAPKALPADVVLSMLGLGVLGTGVAYILNYAVVRQAGATTASTVTYVVPVVSTLLGVIVLGEGLTWNEPVGAVIVLSSVAASQGLLPVRRRRIASSAASSAGRIDIPDGRQRG